MCLLNCDKAPGFPSSVKVIPAFSRGETGTSAFLSRQSMEIDPHFDLRWGKRGSSLLVVGNSAFLSSGDGYLRNLVEFYKACQGPF